MTKPESVKACPFCGSVQLSILKPTCTQQSEYNPADRAYPIVRCRACYAEVAGENWDQTTRSAIEKWNRRVERWKLAQTAMNKVNLHRSA